MKALLTPAFGNTVELGDPGEEDELLGSADERTSFFGFGIASDLLKGPHKIALDYYSGVNTYAYSEPATLADPDNPNAPGTPIELASEERHSLGALLLGYRWHHRSGFYVGGGALAPTGSISAEFTGSASVADLFSDVDIDIDGGSGFALTLGYDWTAPYGMTLGVHVVSGSGRFEYSGTGALEGMDDSDDFRMSQVSFGIGYNFDPQN